MRSSASKFFALAGVFSLVACASDTDNNGGASAFTPPPTTGGTANIPAAGSTSTAGTTAGGGTVNGGGGTSGATNGGATSGGTAGANTGGSGGVVDPGGAGASGAGGAVGGAGGAEGGAGGAAGGAGGAPGGAITAVWPSSACGVATAPAEGMYTIMTSGQKTDCARAGCGDLPDDGTWSETREYSIYLPDDGYDNTVPYLLLFEGPGCGGTSQDGSLYNYQNEGSIIKIGVRPSQNDEIQNSHGTNQNQGCFDDKEGDDSVDFVLYEDLYDLLETQLCFDRNRVFFGGNSSGAWWSNEHGCHYAGDPVRPVRGIMPNTGGLPDQPQFKPTCTTSGMAGMWVHNVGDETNSFQGNIYAIDRAMTVNGCVAGQTYQTADFENYAIPGVADNTCERILGCDPLFPLVVCALPGGGHGAHPEVVNPGHAKFMQDFFAPPLAPTP